MFKKRLNIIVAVVSIALISFAMVLKVDAGTSRAKRSFRKSSTYKKWQVKKRYKHWRSSRKERRTQLIRKHRRIVSKKKYIRKSKKTKIKLTPQQKRKLLQMSPEGRTKFMKKLAERKMNPLRDKLLKKERKRIKKK